MKSILISIKPKWVAKILNGEKTIEIRKSMPKCDLPIDVYIYCTKDKPYLAHATELFTGKYGCVSNDEISYEEHNINGKVVAKFTLNKVERTHEYEGNLLKESCLTINEFCDYLGDKIYGYAWHISNLEIFDIPKELSEFDRCILTEDLSHDNTIHIHQRFKITEAPQSFMYIEVE